MELLKRLKSPILLRGDDHTAFRDPAAFWHGGVFHLWYTLVETDARGRVFLTLSESRSRDLASWSAPRILTPRDPKLNYSSPGNLVRMGDRWVLCLQTYPRPNGEKYGNERSRLWTMETRDLETWGEPRLLRVKGDVPAEAMGRMIDPYLLEDPRKPGMWWCLYKQNGVSLSSSRDLEHWTFEGHAEAGENVCILHHEGRFLLFHSPPNGIGVLESTDLRHWRPRGDLITLGQKNWEWARGRLTAGFVLDARAVPGVGKWLLFFHGSGPGDESVHFDTHASLGLAWSEDLAHWDWAGRIDIS